MKRLGRIVVALLFAIPFSAIGVLCSWGIYKTFENSWSTSDWVKVKANVLQADLVDGGKRRSKTYRASATYAYEYQGRRYQSSSIAVDPFGGGDNVGTWQEEMGNFLMAAKADKRPITVWVNPADPTQAFVDREVRWGLIGLLLPFALVFGGVGVGSFYGLYKAITGKGEAPPRKTYGSARILTAKEVEDVSGSGPRWWLVLAWNGIAWPVAAWVAPAAISKGNYAALFVVLLPLIGAFMLWVAAKETYRISRNSPRSPKEPKGLAQKKSPGQV